MHGLVRRFWHVWLRRPFRLAIPIDRGQGETVLLLHGLASHGSVWQSLADKLAASHHVVAVDLLGFGDSPKPNWLSYTVADHAAAVVATLKKAHYDTQPLTIVGHSMGSLVAVHMATRYPKLVKRIILYEPPLFADSPDFRSHKRRRKLYFAVYDRIANSPTMVLGYTRLIRKAASRLAGFYVDTETWVPFQRSLRNTIMGQTAYDELRAITIPTDIIYGHLDIVVTRHEIKRMFAQNPYVTFHSITGLHDISSKGVAYLVKLVKADPGTS